jgi:sugar phosphate isomerase/epimerase
VTRERTLSLAALTVIELSPVQQVHCAAQAGYSHVGLRLIPATDNEPNWDVVGDTTMLRELRAALRDTGVTALDVEILRLKPETVVADFVAVLDTAASLGARYLLVAGNDPDESRLTERFAALADLAAPLGLSPCLEAMPWTQVRDFMQAARIVEAAARDNAGVLVDAIHFDRGANHADQIASVAPRRLPYAQLCDAPAERPADLETLLHQARAERLPPGEGGLDLAGLVRALPQDIVLSLEVPMRRLSATLPANERALRLRQTTLDWLATLG